MQTKTSNPKHLGLIILAFVAFISLGMPDGLLGVAWPSMRHGFGQPLDALGMLLIFGTAGYVFSSFLSGWFAAKFGVGILLSLSCAATALALLLYTLVPFWWLMAPCAVLSGLGAGAIDAGLNNYVEANHGHRLMQWLHASFGVGITTGPLIMTASLTFLFAWRPGYLVVSAFQFGLALIFLLSASRWSEKKPKTETTISDTKVENAKFSETLKNPRSWASAFLFFVYTGIELGLGHWAYTLLTESRNVEPGLAGLVAGTYWGTFTIGRIFAGFISHHISPRRMIQTSLLFAICGALLLWWNPFAWVSVFGIGLIGLAIAPIFPSMVSATSERVEQKHTANTIGMQMAFASLGVSVLPGLAGILAKTWSIEILPPFILVLASLLLLLISALNKPKQQIT